MKKNVSKTIKKTIAIGFISLLICSGMTSVSAVYTELIAGQHYISGTVYIRYWEGHYLRIMYEAGSDWVINESHLAIAYALSEIPQTQQGNPKIGKFPYANLIPGPIHTYYIDLYDYFPSGNWHGQTLYFAAHAVMYHPIYGEETAWADTWGQPFPGNSNALYFVITLP